MSSLKEQFKSLSAYNEDQIKKLTAALKKFPPGRLRCYKNNGSVRYVLLCEGKKPRTISKKNGDLIKVMAKKAVFEARKKDCEASLKLCRKALEILERQPHAMEKLLADPNICALLAGQDPQADLFAWQYEPYEKNPNYPENLKIPTEAGIYVRSKDEALCVSAILEAGIPFRYEQKLTLKGGVIYPDFTLLDPKSRRVIIMELFGMMDDPGYARKSGRKLALYFENGYMPGYDLLCFFASPEMPLDITEVIRTLKML